MLARIVHELDIVSHPQLFENAAAEGADRFHAEIELRRDLLHRATGGGQFKNLELALRERFVSTALRPPANFGRQLGSECRTDELTSGPKRLHRLHEQL